MTATAGSGQLEWEARAGRLAAAAAFAGGILPVIAGVVLGASLAREGEGAEDFLRALNEASTAVVVGGVIGALGPPLLAAALVFLYRATRARRPEAPSFVAPVFLAGAVALGAVLVLQQVLRVDAAAEFVAAPGQSEEAAEEAVNGAVPAEVSVVGSIASIAFAGSLIVISLNAMRAGLLSRFIGILGIALGFFYVIPLLPGGPVPLQLFWLVALGFLFLGRWPGGRGPAWERVEAIPWPTAADRAEAQRQERVEEAQRKADAYRPPEEAGGEERVSPEGPSRPRPASRKRRRGR